jgi:hypothetical protein
MGNFAVRHSAIFSIQEKFGMKDCRNEAVEFI